MLKDYKYGTLRSIERAVPSHRIRTFQREYYKAYLLSHKKRRILGNSVRWTTEGAGYDLDVYTGIVPVPHIIRYTVEGIHGSRYDTSDLEAPYFLTGLKGLYQVNCGITAEIKNTSDMGTILTFFQTLGEPWARIYKNDLEVYPSGSQFLWLTNDGTNTSVALRTALPSSQYFRSITNFSDIILLDRGDKIDIRMNLVSYALVELLTLNIKSYFSINWINDGGNLWLIQ